MKTLLEATFNVLKSLLSEMFRVMWVGVPLFSGWWLFDNYQLVSIFVALFVIIALFVLFEAGKIEDKKQREIEIVKRLRK